MECPYCKGKLERKMVPYAIHRKGYHVVLDAVPAWVCDQCGEFVFDEKDVENIQRIVAEMDEQVSTLVKAA